MEWLQVNLVKSEPKSLSHLLTAEPTGPLTDAVLLNHRHAVLIRDLPGLDPSVSQATGSMIVSNTRDLVTKQRVTQLKAETLRRRK